MAAGWSSLPNDLVNEISSRLLAADDIDYYMQMRVVCRGWHAAMATIHPKANPADPRFRLRQWVMLDEQYPAESSNDGDTPVRLFINTATGRFLFKELPCLKEHYFISSSGGLLVLASKRAPHSTCVFNPFTDSSVFFTAPIPDSVRHTKAYIRGVGLSLNLLLDDGPLPNTAYLAEPNDDLFTMVEYNLLAKVSAISGLANDHEMIVGGLIDSITANIPGDRHSFYPPVYHILDSAGEKLLVIRRERPAHGVDVFKVDTQEMVIYPIGSIGNRALFLGERCVCVDASKFPSIDGNCVFYFERGHPDNEGTGIYMYDLTNEKEVWVTSNVVDFSWGTEKSVTSPSMIQVLMKYSIDTAWSQLRD